MKISMFLSLTILLLSCQKNNNSIFIDEEHIKQSNNLLKITPPMKRGEVNFDNIIDTLRLLPLETNDSTLISRIDDIKFYDDKIFVADYKANQLIIFNNEGKTIGLIQDRGRASNEYIRLCSFDIDKENKFLYLLDGDNGKILVYNFEAKQKRVISLPYKYINHLVYLGENRFLFEFGFRNYSKERDTSPNLVLFDIKQSREIKEYFYYQNKEIAYHKKNLTTFSSFGNKVYYWTPLGHTIYKHTDTLIQKEIDLDFQSYKTPPMIYRYHKTKAKREMQQNGYAYIDRFYDLGDWLYFRIGRTGTVAHYFYHKNQQKGFIDLSFKNLENTPSLIFPDIFYVSKNEICGYILPIIYVEHIKDNGGVALDDNPILVFYKLKE